MKYLIFYCDVEWNSFNRREFIIEMASTLPEWNVIAINRPASLVPNIFRNNKVKDVLKTFLNPCITQIDSVTLIRPFTFFHDHIGGYVFGGLGNWLQRHSVEKALKKAGVSPKSNDDVVVWLYEQPQWAIADIFSNTKKKVVWEIFDDYRLTAQGNVRKMWVGCEHNMLNKTDHILTLTSSLKEKYLETGKVITVMGNGYPRHLFSPKELRPKDLITIPGNIAMYLGVIRDWIDFELLESLVLENRDLSVVFIGPVVPNIMHYINKLLLQENFYYLGSKSREDVPYYMSAADVAIIPYIENAFTSSVKPIKLFEFLACGTPVVTTTMADISHVNGALYLTNKSSFNASVNLALHEADKAKCIELAKPWSWKGVASNMKLTLGL